MLHLSQQNTYLRFFFVNEHLSALVPIKYKTDAEQVYAIIHAFIFLASKTICTYYLTKIYLQSNFSILQKSETDTVPMEIEPNEYVHILSLF